MQDVRQRIAPRQLLENMFLTFSPEYVLYSSCIALISYIRVAMHFLHFHHPWWSYAESVRSTRASSSIFLSSPCEHQSPYCILAPLITGKNTIYIWISITTPQI